MKITLVAVITVNGMLTRKDDPNIYTWTSKEDQEFFFGLLKKHRLIVMGSKTYEAARGKINLESDTLRVILTSHPETYSSETVAGKLEFSKETPRELSQRLANKGYVDMLLVGGAQVHSAFLKEKLIDELYITLEPLIFSEGKSVIAPSEFESSLELLDVKKMNAKGTLLLHYKILK